ncbi:MAG: hypothetical protein ACJ72O_15615 [Marmoricola sp.]
MLAAITARSRLALSALALASSVVLLAPASDAATTRTISVHVNPNAAIAGHQVTFNGVLGRSPKGSSVKIQRYVGTKWVTAKATLTTTSTGVYATKVTLPTTPKVYKFRALAPGTSKLRVAVSATISVTALRKTAFFFGPIYPADAPLGGDMTVAGSLRSPCTAGAQVSLQRRIGSTWTTVGTSSTTSSSSVCPFQVTNHNAQPGLYRVSIARKGLNAAVTSAATQVDPKA